MQKSGFSAFSIDSLIAPSQPHANRRMCGGYVLLAEQPVVDYTSAPHAALRHEPTSHVSSLYSQPFLPRLFPGHLADNAATAAGVGQLFGQSYAPMATVDQHSFQAPYHCKSSHVSRSVEMLRRKSETFASRVTSDETCELHVRHAPGDSEQLTSQDLVTYCSSTPLRGLPGSNDADGRCRCRIIKVVLRLGFTCFENVLLKAPIEMLLPS